MTLTEYPVIADPPLLAGAVQRTVAEALPRVTAPMVGAPGAVGAAAPVPVRDTVSGLPGALFAMFTVAVFAPAVVGAKVTLTVHEAPGATEAQPATGVAVNDAESVPVTVTPDTTRAAVPVLLTVMARGAEVVATVWPPKARAAAVTEATGAGSRLTVVSLNLSVSMLRTVSTPSAPPLLSTVVLPSAFRVIV